MRRFRFSIAGLLGVVALAAVALAALRGSTDSWDGGVLGLTSLCLLTSVLLAVHRTDRQRAFWLGFALFGWAYLVVSLIPPIGSRLPTTAGLAFISSKVPGRETTVSMVFGYTSTYGTNSVETAAFVPQVNTVAVSSPASLRIVDVTTGTLLAGSGGTTENFIRIGHSLLALVLAFLGGHLSRYLYRAGRGEPSAARPVSSTPL